VTSRGTAQFWKLYRELPPDIRNAARKAFLTFLSSPAHPSLRLERLRSDRRAWAVPWLIVRVTIGFGFGSADTRILTGSFQNNGGGVVAPREAATGLHGQERGGGWSTRRNVHLSGVSVKRQAKSAASDTDALQLFAQHARHFSLSERVSLCMVETS
jgi:hypothetical protein